MPSVSQLKAKEDSETRQGIQSVEIGLHVAKIFMKTRTPMSLKDISAAAGMPPSNTHRYLTSLCRTGLVRQVSGGRYDLGPLALRFGFSVLTRLDTVSCCTEWMHYFTEQTGVSCMLTVWSEEGPVVVRWVQGPQPVYTTITVGSVIPLLGSATGSIFLTYLDRNLIDDGLRKMPDTPLPRQDRQIRTIADTVRKQGFAAADGDLIPQLRAAACPVFDGYGGLVGVITAVSTRNPISEETIEELKSCGHKASINLGWHG